MSSHPENSSCNEAVIIHLPSSPIYQGKDQQDRTQFLTQTFEYQVYLPGVPHTSRLSDNRPILNSISQRV